MKRHFPQLDVLRVLACVMVVFMHSPIPSPGASGPFLAVLSYVTVPCIGLFFMISGALILPVKEPFAVFIKKRLMRIAAPLLLWTLIYLATKHYYGQSQLALWREVISIPFSAQGHGVLWFMYTLTGLYLMAPILTPWLEKASKRELQGVLSVWAVTLCYPLLDYFFILNDSVTGVLYYFTGYAGYFVLGYYLRRYPRGLPGPACWTVGLGGAVLILVLKLRGVDYDFYTLFYYLSIFAACLCAGLWMLAHGVGNKLKYSALWGGVGSLTFGVYLMHILIMRYWLWNMPFVTRISSYPLQTLTVAVLTLVLSFAACRVIALLPGSQWIVGCHKGFRANR